MVARKPNLLCWGYDLEAPSFRERVRAFLPVLEAAGWTCTIERFPRRRYVRRIFERASAIRAADVVLLAKIKLAIGEPRVLLRHAGRIVFDFDDAIWLRRPRRPGLEPGTGRLRQWKFDRTCAVSDLILAGNSTLADRARVRGDRVEVVPTSVEVDRYASGSDPVRASTTAVWVGLPENLAYLERIRPALAEVAGRRPGFRLRIVCSAWPEWHDVPIERVPWSRATEVEALRTADVGLMPLEDDAWARGKCAFKLLQYMAAGLPCLASPVGANREAVEDGVTGRLVDSPRQWADAIAALLSSPEDSRAMGNAGRARARARYDRSATAARWANLIAGRTVAPGPTDRNGTGVGLATDVAAAEVRG